MTNALPIRVLIADDHAMVRQGLRSALKDYPNIEVIGEAGDGDEAVTAALKHRPTIVVMDVNMAKMDGITATRLIKEQHPEIVVLGISADLKDYQVYAMQKAGAFELISKERAVYELYGAIQRAVASMQPIFLGEDNAASLKSLAELEDSSPSSSSS
jgi:DNA-binding NarL/FixJ family response regulator